MCRFAWWPRIVAKAGLLGLFFVFSLAGQAQDDGFKPVPILTGSTAYFTRVTAGQYQDAPSVSPLLLLPLGDKWLVEAKGSYSDTFSKNAKGDYAGTISYGMAYGQIDYIANRYMTLVAGRFTTPFNIYGERLAPNWVRALQHTPLTSPVTSGLVLPHQRLEIGSSFQQVLQAGRPHSSGIFFEWQSDRAPVTVRSEYARSSGTKGSGYWIESVYRLSQISALRRLELVGRGEQFFVASNLSAATIKKLGALGKDTNEADFGMNYYLRSDVRASASYGRQFVLGKNANLWTIGMTYRFVMPMLPQGGAR